MACKCSIPPPVVENGIIISSSEENGTILCEDTGVMYQCLDGFRISGPKTVRCEFPEHWGAVPKCLAHAAEGDNTGDFWEKISSHSGIPLLCIGMLLGLVGLVVYMWKKTRPRKCITPTPSEILHGRAKHITSPDIAEDVFQLSYKNIKGRDGTSKRNKENDALVIYFCEKPTVSNRYPVSQDEQYVLDNIFPKFDLNEGGNYNIYNHRQDFVNGRPVMVNFQMAVENSNSVVIILSQNFVNSDWCHEELEICMREHKKDAAFKIFIILTGPWEALNFHNFKVSKEQILQEADFLLSSDQCMWSELNERLAKVQTILKSKPDIPGQLVKRNKEYDAFVVYSCAEPTKTDAYPISPDEQFFEDNILPRYDQSKGGRYKLFFHRRDFIAGIPVMDNIYKGVQSSNAAIILISQDFIESKWCCPEFEICMAEHSKDSAFKMFAILMQPKETLTGIPISMKLFFRNVSYLQKGEVNLWQKLDQRLAEIKSDVEMSGKITNQRDVTEAPHK